MRMRQVVSLAVLPLAALACSSEKREAPPLSDPQLESMTGPPSPSTAAMAAGGETMTIVEVVPTGGGWPWIDVADYWDPPYLEGRIPPLPYEDLPLRIVSKNEQGDIVGELVITEEMLDEEEEPILPSGEEWSDVLMMSAVRADLLVLKDTAPAEYETEVEWWRSGLATEQSERDSLMTAALLRELGEL